MNIVFLDAFTTNPGDLNWKEFRYNSTLKCYDRTPAELVYERAKLADVLIVNKQPLDATTLDKLDKLKCICVAATGFDNVDIGFAAKQNIPVFNVQGYSSQSVAERVFAMMFHHYQNLDPYFSDFRSNVWAAKEDFSYWHQTIRELSGKTIGLVGMGAIAQKVSGIANALGMRVLYHSRSKMNIDTYDLQYAELEELLQSSDFVSLHIPLNEETKGMVDSNFLNKMKSDAVFINTSRGAIVDENAMAEALDNRTINAAYVDVLSKEPPAKDHVLTKLDNCHVTPHTAWASLEARTKLIQGVAENIDHFLIQQWKSAVNYNLFPYNIY